MLLPTTRLQSAGVSLLLASGCWLGVVPPGLADPPAEPAAVSAPASTLMTLEQVRTISALQEMGSLPSEEKTALRRVSLENSQLKDKGALKVLKSGQEYAARGADPETQTLDVEVLRKAEERFNLLVEDLAPSFSGGYANRANVRVALKDYAGAVEDYEMALRLSPLSDDAWVNWLNRGSTLIALGQPERALPDLQRSVELSKAAAEKLSLLGRGSALHALGRWEAAAADYGAVVSKAPSDVQPFWLRYGLELLQVGRTQDALGIVRRVAAKFDIEPECQLALYAATNAAGGERGTAEAQRLWSVAPGEVKQRVAELDLAQRQWPPAAADAARTFLRSVASAWSSGE
ncbi:hypothetical protein EMIHUDRAFT_205984 [Emiliania huxleyi CCMP1516]|uniref:Tetratricopeptide repeat protein n=2 Tax=Emiliania huxleyi TaxID=2903 RepID=A0A0D3JQP1_EMIH1|nr:hypothetical protein EMIHUDRAFT_205984 [Emiliania huxleyi CCMP1516]EOD25826.1 hypothetical protein EMIHUDRAFT_205984 [Emiliania huxleyi CCMP1516]|eukprot:XP_005778255.1 hypothetical protein EMIHUDRAFT_205984 [Emiliania huxleyi CCMP1516]